MGSDVCKRCSEPWDRCACPPPTSLLEMAERGMTLEHVSAPRAPARAVAPQKRPVTPLRDQPTLIVAVADKIREARGAGPWSTDNLPGKDQERARLLLTIVDGWLTGQAGAAPLREFLDELRTLVRTALGALGEGETQEAVDDLRGALTRIDDWNRAATR